MTASAPTPRWLSANPGKAWAERCFLLLSPAWMALMGAVMALGIDERLGDAGFLALGVLVAGIFVAVPAVASPENRDRPWHRTYWFKANLYIAIFGFFGNYVGSEYFFDVLGMVYAYPAIHWNLDTALVGSGEQRVPVLMYLLTHAYFMTYHSSAIVVIRRIRTAGLPRVAVPLAFFVVGYAWAWLETKSMANPLIADSFTYRDMDRMLRYGSAFYALYFLASFPIFAGIDEQAERAWTIREVVFAALAASMIVFFLLDFATHVVGTLY